MERKVMQEFIEIYHSEPSLWKIRSSNYNNKNIKSMAYNKMVAKLRELYPDADVELVKRKINALRTNYRKELRKVEASRERNRLTGEPCYVPSLWYYELFHFIADQESEDVVDITDDGSGLINVQDILRVDFEEDMNQFEAEESDEFEEEYQVSSPESSRTALTNGNVRPMPITNFENPNPSKRRRTSFKSDNQRFPRIQQRQPPAEPSDGHEMFGRYVASRLRVMDTHMQTLSERLISEVLFRGQMGLLGRNTCVSDDDLPIHPIKVED